MPPILVMNFFEETCFSCCIWLYYRHLVHLTSDFEPINFRKSEIYIGLKLVKKVSLAKMPPILVMIFFEETCFSH